MRLLVLSDLHVKFSPFQPDPKVLKTVDVVVLAAFGSHLPEHLFDGRPHSSCAYQVDQCLVVCNPRGYPMGRARSAYENEAFDPHLQLELSKDGLWSKAR